MYGFMQVYFWFMVVYLAASVIFKIANSRKNGAASVPPGVWLEELAGYVVLALGLIGVYGYLQAIPIFSAGFWKAFTFALALFAALQYFMPKLRLLREMKGPKVALGAILVGALLLAPMLVAVAIYGFESANVWMYA